MQAEVLGPSALVARAYRGVRSHLIELDAGVDEGRTMMPVGCVGAHVIVRRQRVREDSHARAPGPQGANLVEKPGGWHEVGGRHEHLALRSVDQATQRFGRLGCAPHDGMIGDRCRRRGDRVAEPRVPGRGPAFIVRGTQSADRAEVPNHLRQAPALGLVAASTGTRYGLGG